MNNLSANQVIKETTPLVQCNITYNIPKGTRNLLILISAECESNYRDKGSLVTYSFIDSEENKATPVGSYAKSRILGPFFYLDINDNGDSKVQHSFLSLEVPPGAERLELAGKQWKKPMETVVHSVHIAPVTDQGLTKVEERDLPDWAGSRIDDSLRKPWARRFVDRASAEPGNSSSQKLWSIEKEILGKPKGILEVRKFHGHTGDPSAHRIKVALICDEFTYNSFAPEFDSIVLHPDTWQEQIEEFGPDLFLCESAWSGVDPKARPWRGKIYGSVKFKYENRQILFDILKYTEKNGIRSVFWNKEDPTHFPDRVNDFVSTASRFDYVLTTAEECVEDYYKFMGAGRVGVMQFAAQPQTFNPLSSVSRNGKSIFAGAWYKVHDQRSEVMHKGFEYVMKSGIPLEIFDRNFGNKGDLQFPETYQKFVKPSVSHARTAELYRQYSLGINFNTVTDSNTMFARRVFELAASGTTIITNYSPGIEKIYGDNVIYFDQNSGSMSTYNEKELSKMTTNALEITMRGHTYRHRFEELLTFVGLSFTSSREKPTMAVRISDQNDAERAIAIFKTSSNIYSRLLLVVSDEVATSDAGAYMTRYMSKMITVVSQSLIDKEKVPSKNYVYTADVIWVDIDIVPSRSSVEKVLLHGEYTHLPITVKDREAVSWGAGSLQSGMRITAADMTEAILAPNSVFPILEVPR